MAYSSDLAGRVAKNTNFREVLATTAEMQLVVMSLEPNEELGAEIHRETTQFLYIESGTLY